MKILVAVDGSESSMNAIDEAARIPWPAGSALKIFSVAEMPSPVMVGEIPVTGSSYAEWEKALEDQAVANTAKALSRFYEKGGSQVEVTARSVKGDAKESILDEAEQWGADLILIGTHGYNILERMLLGSVSRAVASHAKCSVEIARRRAGQPRPSMRILLAFDGSECGELAVKEVAGRPWPAGSEVRVISVIQLPFTPTPETWALPDSYYSHLEKVGREVADKSVKRALEVLRESNGQREAPLTLTTEVILGRAEDMIIKAAKEWEADLVVLGAHGYRGIERFLLGSVSQGVAWHAPCSVRIVRARPK